MAAVTVDPPVLEVQRRAVAFGDLARGPLVRERVAAALVEGLQVRRPREEALAPAVVAVAVAVALAVEGSGTAVTAQWR